MKVPPGAPLRSWDVCEQQTNPVQFFSPLDILATQSQQTIANLSLKSKFAYCEYKDSNFWVFFLKIK